MELDADLEIVSTVTPHRRGRGRSGSGASAPRRGRRRRLAIELLDVAGIRRVVPGILDAPCSAAYTPGDGPGPIPAEPPPLSSGRRTDWGASSISAATAALVVGRKGVDGVRLSTGK